MVVTAKVALRRAVLTARRAVDDATHAREAEQIAALLTRLSHKGEVTCAYVPTGTEPGSLRMLQDQHAAGVRVLLPLAGADGELDWAEFTGSQDLRRGRFGLLEPTGRTLGPEAITEAHRVVVPALAVDRRGTRLGRGAGYYDRALRRVPEGVALLAVVRSEEVYAQVPRETHDVAVHGALTPAGLIRLDAAL